MKIAPFVLVASLLSATVAHAATATPADRAFVAKVSQGGMFEVAAGKLAETRGSTQDVRDFATAEVHDHMLVGAKLKAISSSEGVTFPETPNAEFSAKMATLKGLSGAAFDDAYMSDMAALHDADGAAFLKESAEGGSAAYRAFGAETHRIVQRHIGAIHGTQPPRS
jgi:putative membrane protein